MKKLLITFIAIAMMTSVAGCGGNSENSTTSEQKVEEKILNLEGEWKQTNSESPDSYHKAIISGETIEIYWSSDKDNTQALYWAGSYVKPTANDKKYSWDSVNDKEKTNAALLASGDDTKTFTYENDVISYSASAFGVTRTIELKKQKVDTNNEPQPTEQAKTPKQTSQKTFEIGETWTVDGQWSLTINSVTATDERNQFEDKKPAAVYIVDYTYTNIGYEPNITDGLYFSITDTIVDSAGVMGYSYPGTVTNYPQSAPIGATCKAQACIGVDNIGDFTLHVSQYDNNSKKHSAKFNVTVQ